MVKNWISKFSNKDDINDSNSGELITIINFLRDSYPDVAYDKSLASNIKTYKKLLDVEKIIVLPSIYLFIEKSILESNIENKPSKRELRDIINNKFYSLLKYPNFQLIFLPTENQEIIICRKLLRIIKDQFLKEKNIDENEDDFIKEINLFLNPLLDFTGVDYSMSEKKIELEVCSKNLFNKIKETINLDEAISIYNLAYKEIYDSYFLLDAFAATLSIIPIEVLEKDTIGLPDKKRILKILKKQTQELEKKNDKLSEEIYQRKKIESALKESEQLKSMVIETAMDAIILLDEEGIILNWNHRAETILGWEKNEAVGQSIDSIFTNNLTKLIKQGLNTYTSTGTSDILNDRKEVPIKNKAGIKIEVELTLSPIKTQYGFLFNMFLRDITLKKFVDKGIREAKLIAEKSTEAKSVFLSNMSHEIRTPLNVILGLTGLLQKDNLLDINKTRENIDGIKFSAENLLALVNDILDFSKIEAGKLTLNPTDFNLYELITNISRGFQIKAKEKGLNFIVDLDVHMPKFVIGDQYRLNQILTNLLGNAIKFTSQGLVKIKVKVIEKQHNTTLIEFAVSDTGIGIPEDKLNQIFTSFYQVHKPGKNKIEGTGLGLSISKQLIELHNGELKAYSKVDEGSEFKFQIQYKKSYITSNDKIQGNDISTEFNLSGLKILVVEDNKMNQFYLKQLLSSWDIKIDTADDGQIAIDLLKEKNYDLILMDLHMPVMDGAEATKYIRTNPKEIKQNEIPIVMCSADVFPKSRIMSEEAGANFYLTKPISEEAIKEILLRLKSDNISNISIDDIKKNDTKDDDHDDSPFLDLTSLKETFSNDIEFIKSILQIFIDDTPKDYNQLKILIGKGDYQKASKLAHKVKSSFRTLGMTKPTNLLQKIESNPDNNGNLEILSELNQIYLKAMNEVHDKLISYEETENS